MKVHPMVDVRPNLTVNRFGAQAAGTTLDT